MLIIIEKIVACNGVYNMVYLRYGYKYTQYQKKRGMNMKKVVLSFLIALTLTCSVTGCGNRVPTERDIEKAAEKVEKGKMNRDEYFEMYDAFINNEPYKSGGGFFATVGELVLVGAVVGGIVVVIKKKRDNQ